MKTKHIRPKTKQLKLLLQRKEILRNDLSEGMLFSVAVFIFEVLLMVMCGRSDYSSAYVMLNLIISLIWE